MTDLSKAATTLAALVMIIVGLAGCNPPAARATTPFELVGVTPIDDGVRQIDVVQLSANGRAAVGRAYDPPTTKHYLHSYYWTAAAGVKVIRTQDGREVEVEAISADGRTAAGRFYDENGKARLAHLFRWTAMGGVEDLGAPEGQDPASCNSYGCGVTTITLSADGAVIFASVRDGEGAFRWTRGTGLRKLNIPGDISAATPDGRMVVGWFDDAAHGRRVFRWSEAGGFEDLGAPAGDADFPMIWVRAVSADGSTIAGEYMTSKDNLPGAAGMPAFRWTRASGFQDLAADGEASVSAISADGSRILGTVQGVGVVIWLQGGSPRRIGPPALNVSRAFSLSGDGKTIAVADQVWRAFLLHGT